MPLFKIWLFAEPDVLNERENLINKIASKKIYMAYDHYQTIEFFLSMRHF
jgi:hypothetical protein